MGKSIKSEVPFVDALRAKFGRSSHAILTQVEVPFGAGYQLVDAMVLGKLPSFDLSIQGFEIKATRGNWLQEMKNPAKSAGGSFFCDGWSLLTYPGVADPEEIPPLWGHWVLDGYRLVILKDAPALEAKPVDRSFVARVSAALVDQAGQNIDLLSSKAEYDRGFTDGKHKGYNEAEAAQGYIETRLTRQAIEIERLNAKLRTSRFSNFNEEELDAIMKTVAFFRKGGSRMQERMDAIELFSSLGPDEIKRQLESLYETSCLIKNAIEERLRVIPIINQEEPGKAP